MIEENAPCHFCGKPTRSHVGEDVHICHSCFTDQPKVSRSFLNERDTSQDEVFEELEDYVQEFDGGVSAEIPDDWKEAVREHIEEFTPDVETATEELINQISSLNPPQLLGHIYYEAAANEAVYQNHDDFKDFADITPRMLEYLLGLCIKYGGGDEDASLENLNEKVRMFQTHWLRHFMKEAKDDGAEISGFEDFGVINSAFGLFMREFTTGRFVYPSQHLESAKRFYQLHNTQLEQQLGFTIDDAVDLAKTIVETIAERSERFLEKVREDYWLKREAHGDFIEFCESYAGDEEECVEKYLQSDRHDEYEAQVEESQQELQQILRETISFTQQELEELYARDSETLAAILDRLSVEVGTWGRDFRLPYDFNPVHARPIIKYSERYFIPFPPTLCSALANTFFYDLTPSEERSGGGDFGRAWGNHLEQWAWDILSDVFNPDAVLRNPEYQINGEDYETDLVVKHNERLIVIECKTQKLTLETRSGDYEAVQDDVKKSISAGASQADRLIAGIESREVRELVCEDGRRLDLSDIDEFLPVILLREPYDSIATSEYTNLVEYDNIPYVVDVYNLQILGRMLGAKELVEYLERRIAINGAPAHIWSTDEMDFLAAYKQNQLNLPKEDEEDAFLDIGNFFYQTELEEKVEAEFGHLD